VTRFAEIDAGIVAAGLSPLGALRLEDGEISGVSTLALVGMVGRTNWPAFAASREYADGESHPLDRFSRRVVGALAERLGARALFPFAGPPYYPFQRWAQQAAGFSPSPLGLLVHREYGLWASFRGALAFGEPIDLPASPASARPCDGCAEKPCLSACPVGAFTGAGYNVEACTAHLRSVAGHGCRHDGCLARRACPIGQGQAYGPEQARFYMEAFVRSFGG